MSASYLLSRTLVWLAAVLLPLQVVPSACACPAMNADASITDARADCCAHQQPTRESAGDCGDCQATRGCSSSHDCNCCRANLNCGCFEQNPPISKSLPAPTSHGHQFVAAPVASASAALPPAPALVYGFITNGALFAPSSLERCVGLSRLTL